MSLPTELPRNALTALANQFKGDGELPQTVLGAYELLGYGLYLYFGDVKYLMGATPEAVALVNKFLTFIEGPEFQAVLKDAPKYAAILTDYLQLQSQGVPTWLIVIRLVAKYGASAVALIVKIVNLLKG